MDLETSKTIQTPSDCLWTSVKLACLILRNNQIDRYPIQLCLSLSLSFSPFSMFAVQNRPTRVSGKNILSHTLRGRERTLNAQTTQTKKRELWSKGNRERSLYLSLSTPPSLPPSLSWSVVQQKNGSIKSWSSSHQVTPRKWVLFCGVNGESNQLLVLKGENESCAS